MKTIRKYFWQLIGALLALLAIFATYHVVFLSRPTKALRVLVDPPVSLVDIRPEAAEDIDVFYKGNVVSNISLLQISIENSGNQPVRESDYSRPLSFSFSPDYALADVAVTGSDPPNIGMTVRKTSDFRAEVVPTLLNPDDVVTVRFIVVGASSESVLEDFEVDGRIAGIKEVELISSAEQISPPWLGASEAVVAVLSVVLSLLSSIFTERIYKRARTLLRRLMDLTAKPRSAEDLAILSAAYGAQGKTKDVTDILASKIRRGRLEILVTNDNLGGDPIPGVVKKLEVVYSYAGQEHSITVDERETLLLP